LERRRISPSQVRSILVLDTTARAMQPRRSGDTRLYSAVDLAIVRLAVRLRAEGVSPTVARVIVATLRESIVEIWAHARPMALAVIGMRGLLLWRGKQPAAAAACVDLLDVWRGVTHAIQVVRGTDEEVWRWTWKAVADLTNEEGHADVQTDA